MGSWVGWDMPLVTGGDRPGRPGGWWDRVEKPSRHGAGAVLLEVGWDMPLADAPVTGGDRPGRPGGWWDTVEWGGQEQSATVTPPAGGWAPLAGECFWDRFWRKR